MYKTMEIHKH